MEDTKGIKAILRRYNELLGEKQMLELEIKEAEEIAGLQGIAYDKDRISTTYTFNSSTENEALHIYLLKERKIHLESLIKRIDAALEQMPELERNILIWRYKQGKSWREIQYKVRYQDRNTYYLHAKALEEFEKRLFPRKK